MMSRTGRLREAIHHYLDSVGEASTTEILDHLNRRFRWGATMNQLGNILARDRRFLKSWFSSSSSHGHRERVCLWALSSA